ncbi:ergothioneine biosynthesis protein EgtB [Acidovorax sp. Leaf160]|uniref:ergothioneine biosynthesis protein EgtB n=1 Tax=Acidovorax sp. Leaf160 TaxID=1736280 RepID=UPI000700296F|nr:ergothioneine biosynthesis protein EgtB [Acidovorax sp. Leaf160]KQR56150.1 hypothetical protein ASF94_19140 [Acidovorax sp. Leaf160]
MTRSLPSHGGAPLRQVRPSAISQRYNDVRQATAALAMPLTDEDCCAQSMPDASPVKWHLAHTTWFFETFVLESYERGFQPFHPAFRVLFNSYYNGLGAQHPRAQRGLLTRPALPQVLAYRMNVDGRMAKLLQERADDAALQALVELGLQHEQQHQELILTDVKHLLSCNPLWPSYEQQQQRATPAAGGVLHPAALPLGWRRFDGGVVDIGHSGDGFAFDNESPRHRVCLQPYQLASRLVTNGEYLAFVEDGGYQEPAHWLAEGWDWRKSNQLNHPLYWRPVQSPTPARPDGPVPAASAAAWEEFTLGGASPLAPHRPVVHLSYYEADAYARWAGARLPTEAEWESAAAGADSSTGHFADSGEWHPRAAQGNRGNQGSQGTQGTQLTGDMPLAQLFGDAWQWTQSSYAAYPGFRIADGAVGEYNGKFMVNQYVLRGGSCVTPAGHVRATYRNFFPATARWQVSGIRLARDA